MPSAGRQAARSAVGGTDGEPGSAQRSRVPLMRCPFCSCTSNRVIDSRETRDGAEIRRRRECDECRRRFTTRERLDEMMPKIVKRDERREEYDRSKLEH